MIDYVRLYNKYLPIVYTINEARDHLMQRSKMCVSVYLYGRNNIASIGINRDKTHPLLIKYGYDEWNYYNEDNGKRNYHKQFAIHSELDGYIKLLKCNKEFSYLLCYRGYTGESPSKPCHICAKWINRIKDLMVIYIDPKTKKITYDYSGKIIGYYSCSQMNQYITKCEKKGAHLL